MVGILKSKVTTYEFTPADIKTIIAAELGVPVDDVSVYYTIQEIGGDSMDHFRGVDTVTKIQVQVMNGK